MGPDGGQLCKETGLSITSTSRALVFRPRPVAHGGFAPCRAPRTVHTQWLGRGRRGACRFPSLKGGKAGLRKLVLHSLKEKTEEKKAGEEG